MCRRQDTSDYCDIATKLKKTGLDELSDMLVKSHMLIKDDTKILSGRIDVWVKWTNKLINCSGKAIRSSLNNFCFG